jgi:hypothetical protein
MKVGASLFAFFAKGGHDVTFSVGFGPSRNLLRTGSTVPALAKIARARHPTPEPSEEEIARRKAMADGTWRGSHQRPRDPEENWAQTGRSLISIRLKNWGTFRLFLHFVPTFPPGFPHK